MKSISKIDSRLSLEYLKNAPENQYLERKRAEIQPAKLANELIGMLNADGWVIVVWISEEGEVTGVQSLQEEAQRHLRKIVFDYISPPSNIELEEVELEDGEMIFLYHVYQDYERVFCRKDNEAVFQRVSDANKGPLSREQVKALEYNRGLRRFEDEERRDFDPADLRRKGLEYYKEKIEFQGDIEDLLVKKNLATRKQGELVYKNAAILLFSEDPDKYIPSAWVRYVRIAGASLQPGKSYNVVKEEEFRGGIPRLIETIRRFMRATLVDYYYLDLESGKFEKVPEYPTDAWLEWLVNALCHRSYNLQGNCVYIKHYDDRIEIANSGPLPAQVTVENIRDQRYSRNPRITRVLFDLGYVRELNEGVNRIYSSMKESMLSEPRYTDKDNIVTLALENKLRSNRDAIDSRVLDAIQRNWVDMCETERKIIAFLLYSSPAVKKSELIAELSVTEVTVNTNLKKLMDKWILQKESTKKVRDKNAIFSFKKSREEN